MARTSRISFPESSGMVDISSWLNDPRPLPSIPPLAPAEVPERRSPLHTILGVSSLVIATVALAIAVGSARGVGSTDGTPATVPPPEPDATSAAAAPAPEADEEVSQPPIEAASPQEPEVDPGAGPAAEPEPVAARAPSSSRPSTPRTMPPTPSLRREWDNAVAGTDDPEDAPPPEPSSLDALLDRALSGSGGSAPTQAESLPDTPSRDEIARVLRGLSDEVAQCRESGVGPTIATTRVVIHGATGRVARVTVDGDLAWTTVGACIGQTLEQARFPRFARDTFEVRFPYRL